MLDMMAPVTLAALMRRSLLFAQRAGGVGVAGQAAVGDHDAFGDGLFGRSQQALVEPDGVRAGDFVQAVGDFGGIETAAQHLRSQQAHAAADWTGGKHFLNHLAVVIDGDVKVLAVERNLPGGAAQFARTLDAHRRQFRRGDTGFGQQPLLTARLPPSLPHLPVRGLPRRLRREPDLPLPDRSP